MQSHISRHAYLYQVVTETGCIFSDIAIETIAYATVINANSPGFWPCHERYGDKQVTRKARHNSHGEVPYEKTNVVPNYPYDYDVIY